MEVKGTAFLARRDLVARLHGTAALDAILAEVAAVEPFWGEPVLATTRIPMAAFLVFNQAIIDRFYDGDPQANFTLGEESAAWAFEGPYKNLVASRDLERFVASAPTVYRNYYDQGDAKAEQRGSEIRVSLVGIPATYRSIAIEYGVMGYFRCGLHRVTGQVATMAAKRGFSRGDDDVLYHFRLPRI